MMVNRTRSPGAQPIVDTPETIPCASAYPNRVAAPGNRVAAVRGALDATGANTYLEIGVFMGFSFLPIRARRKIAVDPVLRIPRWLRWIGDRRAEETHYCEMTSDAFFDRRGDLLADTGIDVALIDGLHTHEQSLKDVETTLTYLNEGGVIVLHDCNPTKPSMAHGARSCKEFRRKNFWRSAWCGDVWKTIVYLRSRRPDLRVAVLDCDFGLGLVRKGRPEDLLDYTPEQITTMDYESLAADRKHLLNLKEPGCFATFVAGR